MTSIAATEYTEPLSLSIVESVLKNIEKASQGDSNAINEIRKASAIAGVASSNSSLGMCHALAHALEVQYHMPHEVAVSICLIPSMIYNLCEAPQKMGIMPQYKYPCSDERYAEIADSCIGCDTQLSVNEKSDILMDRISQIF